MCCLHSLRGSKQWSWGFNNPPAADEVSTHTAPGEPYKGIRTILNMPLRPAQAYLMTRYNQHRATTIIVAGTAYLVYLPQLIG